MNTVVACIDGSRASAAVCDYAAWASLRLAAPLQFLHVLDRSRFPVQGNLSGVVGLGTREHLLDELAALDEQRGKLALEQGRLMLDAARARAIADGVSQPQVRQRHGDLVDTLLELEPAIRLLVLGRQGEQGNSVGAHLGNEVERVARALHRPILITPLQFAPPAGVLIAFDGSETMRKSLQTLAASPLLQGLAVHVLLVGADTAAHQAQLDWAKEQLASRGFAVTAVRRSGEPESVLEAYRLEQGLDWLVMGAYGHSRIRQFLVGSTTTAMLRRVPCPILLLR